MKFLSTRGKQVLDNASSAIVQGLSTDGGLFVPETFPQLGDKLSQLASMTYAERACMIIGSFLEEYDKSGLLNACKNAYSKFEDCDPAPVVKVDDKMFVMELFHGPTLAFKDVALTLLPYLLRAGADYCGIKENILILTATSGDTGKAALEGFKDANGIKIIVFYPSEGVSDMQKLQMQTQEGDNVKVVGVYGNFDDCQNAVKKIFSDNEIKKQLLEQGVILSSANSINFGRLVPQVCYYFSAYCDLINSGEINLGDKVDFVVPTGNFGNILAGYYAKKMGLPVGKLVCASNTNNVLTDFFMEGTYDANREFFKTVSPSMDILVSSNLERLVFEFSGRDGQLTAERMNELKSVGKYSLTEQERLEISKEFSAGYTCEEDCFETIKNTFEEYGYLLDTHTAVAYDVACSFNNSKSDDSPTVVLSTASPYKFTQSVLCAIDGKSPQDPFVSANKLNQLTAMDIPSQITSLKDKQRRFTDVVERENTLDAVLKFINE